MLAQVCCLIRMPWWKLCRLGSLQQQRWTCLTPSPCPGKDTWQNPQPSMMEGRGLGGASDSPTLAFAARLSLKCRMLAGSGLQASGDLSSPADSLLSASAPQRTGLSELSSWPCGWALHRVVSLQESSQNPLALGFPLEHQRITLVFFFFKNLHAVEDN